MFTATLTVQDYHSEVPEKSYAGSGDTIFDAISNIPFDRSKFKIKAVLTVSDGEKKAERLFYVAKLKAIFASKPIRQVYAKQFQMLLK